MTTCLISLGGNIGDVAQTIDSALTRLHAPPIVRVTRRSSLHRTPPVGAAADSEFVNAAAMLETTLTAHELLDRMHAIETELGRVRTVRWGSRTLDLDLIFYGDHIIRDTPRLQVPHPACWYRRFVLDPMTEIAGDFVHPEKGLSIWELRERLRHRPLCAGVVCVDAETVSLTDSLRATFAEVSFVAIKLGDGCSDDLPLIIWLGPDSPPPWTDRLRGYTGWLDASRTPGHHQQTLIDIVRSAVG